MAPSVYAPTVSEMPVRLASHHTFDPSFAADADEDDGRTMVALVQDPATKTLSLETVPLPIPSGPDEHLVQVHAVALARGEMAWPGRPGLAAPAVPGYEFAGTVVLAPQTSPFQPGAEVYACTSVHRPGSACEYTLARTHEMCQKPENLSWEEAATVPRSALAAWQALFVLGGLRPPPSPGTGVGMITFATHAASAPSANADKRVLVTEAAGGVGLWAVQLARLAGVGHVAGTCGSANLDFVGSLGAHHVAEAPVHGAYDLVVHCGEEEAGEGNGHDDVQRPWIGARRDGAMVCMASGMQTIVLTDRGGNRTGSTHVAVQADSMPLQIVTDLVEAGAAKAAFDSAFAPEQYEAALSRVQDRHLRGKVVLRLD